MQAATVPQILLFLDVHQVPVDCVDLVLLMLVVEILDEGLVPLLVPQLHHLQLAEAVQLSFGCLPDPAPRSF